MHGNILIRGVLPSFEEYFARNTPPAKSVAINMILEQKVFGFSLLSTAIIGYILCVLGISLYRVFFHPLSKYSGPKLAAATVWYQTYYDVWMGGELAHQVKNLHKKYGKLLENLLLVFKLRHSKGPIVRVGPNEVTILWKSPYSAAT